MPVKQSSFSSHLITTVISQSFILLFDKGTKEKAREMGRNLSLAGNREERERVEIGRPTLVENKYSISKGRALFSQRWLLTGVCQLLYKSPCV